jgi:hypothetical protein
VPRNRRDGPRGGTRPAGGSRARGPRPVGRARVQRGAADPRVFGPFAGLLRESIREVLDLARTGLVYHGGSRAVNGSPRLGVPAERPREEREPCPLRENVRRPSRARRRPRRRRGSRLSGPCLGAPTSASSTRRPRTSRGSWCPISGPAWKRTSSACGSRPLPWTSRRRRPRCARPCRTLTGESPRGRSRSWTTAKGTPREARSIPTGCSAAGPQSWKPPGRRASRGCAWAGIPSGWSPPIGTPSRGTRGR